MTAAGTPDYPFRGRAGAVLPFVVILGTSPRMTGEAREFEPEHGYYDAGHSEQEEPRHGRME
jgi:hypothetical protein